MEFDDEYGDEFFADMDEMVMNHFYQGNAAPTPVEYPTTLDGVCTRVTTGPVYDKFCGKNLPIETGYPCLVYSCPGKQFVDGKYSPEWKQHVDVLNKYFNDNIKCPYDTAVDPVGPPYNGIEHLRGFCPKQVVPDGIAP